MGRNRTPKTIRREKTMIDQTQPNTTKDNRELAILSPKTGSALTFSSTS
jgi:hypothetical protein